MVASSNPNNQTASSARAAAYAGRLSFAKIHEPLEVPNLLALQTESFDRLVGNERWVERLTKAEAAGERLHSVRVMMPISRSRPRASKGLRSNLCVPSSADSGSSVTPNPLRTSANTVDM